MAMGYFDVHFTHGNVEFGKDFIAKKKSDDAIIQYSFQSKAGNINLAEWRNPIRGQMLEAATSGLSHPQFDKNLSHQSVLITTGKLAGNVALDLQELNNGLLSKLQITSIITWERNNLIEYFETYGLSVLLQITAESLTEQADFFIVYAKCLQQKLSDREIELYSRKWINTSVDSKQHLLRIAIESELLAHQCLTYGRVYEAVQVYSNAIRGIARIAYKNNGTDHHLELIELYKQTLGKVERLCVDFVTEFECAWHASSSGIVSMQPQGMMEYLVICARVTELSSLAYFFTDQQDRRDAIARFLYTFVEREPGCGHIPSDRHAVSLVLATLVFASQRENDYVHTLIRRAAVWLFDRYEKGIGLATFEADEYIETATLLGCAYELPNVVPASGSLVASVLADLAAFSCNRELYSEIINDLKALQIFPNYWQTPDKESLFSIDGEDVVGYPNIEYDSVFQDFQSFDFAQHIRAEPRDFALRTIFGAPIFIMLMFVLRDRYFPTMWPYIASK